MASSTSRRDFLTIGSGLLIGFSLSDSATAPQLMAADTAPNPSRRGSTHGFASASTIMCACSPEKSTSAWESRQR